MKNRWLIVGVVQEIEPGLENGLVRMRKVHRAHGIFSAMACVHSAVSWHACHRMTPICISRQRHPYINQQSFQMTGVGIWGYALCKLLRTLRLPRIACNVH